MDKHILIPLALFLCITYAFKSVLDVYARRKSRESVHSPEMMRHAIDQEQRVQRRNALRWGIALVALSLASGLIGFFHLDDSPVLSIAVLLGAAGVANLCYVAITRGK